MIKGFRFTNQLANAEIDARIHQELLNKNDGIFYGMDLSKTSNSVTISEGLCEIAGRPVAVIDSETIEVGTDSLYCVLVLEIDLSKESTKDTFSQVTFKLLTSSTNYSTLIQQDINKYNGTDNIYQLEFARFKTGINGITEFIDTRKFLNFKNIFEEIRQEISNIKDGSAFSVKPKILWENSMNSITFEEQTIELSTADYDYLVIFSYRNADLNLDRTLTTIVEKNKFTDIFYTDRYYQNRNRTWTRQLEIKNETSIKFYDAYIDGETLEYNNNILVPYKIIGFKY